MHDKLAPLSLRIARIYEAVGSLEQSCIACQIEIAGIRVGKVDDTPWLYLTLLYAIAEFLPVSLAHLSRSTFRVLHNVHFLCKRQQTIFRSICKKLEDFIYFHLHFYIIDGSRRFRSRSTCSTRILLFLRGIH